MKTNHSFRKSTRLVSLFLAMVLIFSVLPMSAFANSGDYTILEVAVSSTTIRDEPSENATILADVSSGDILFCTDSLYNEYDNLWYKVICGDGYGYIYNGKVETHEHSMSDTTLSDGTEISFCRCGEAVISSNGVTQTNALALNPQPLVDAAALLGAANALSGTIGAGLSVAFPYIAAGVALGVSIYVYAKVHPDAASIEVIDVYDLMEVEYFSKNFETGKYYPALTYKGQVWYFPSSEFAMDMEEAVTFLDHYASGVTLLVGSVGSQNIPMGSVYTVNPTDAKKLGKALAETGKYDYGDDSTPNHECGWNKSRLKVGNLYYEHYHIFRTTMPHIQKVCGAHIFFGIPYTGGTYA